METVDDTKDDISNLVEDNNENEVSVDTKTKQNKKNIKTVKIERTSEEWNRLIKEAWEKEKKWKYTVEKSDSEYPPHDLIYPLYY